MRGFGKSKLIGSGGSKEVYNSSESKDSAVQEFRIGPKMSQEQVKGRFYLTKILHALLPKNIPQIEASVLDPETGKEKFVTEKKYRDKVHIAYNHRYHTPYDVSDKDLRISEGRAHKVVSDQRYLDLVNTLKILGVQHDKNAVNYSYDSEDIENPQTNIQLLDNDFVPWEIDKKDESIILSCSFPELKNAIENIKDESVRSSARQYYDRLKELLKTQLSKLPDYEVGMKLFLPEDISI